MEIIYEDNRDVTLFEDLKRGDTFVIAPGKGHVSTGTDDIYMKIITPSGMFSAVNLTNGSYYGAVGGLHVVKKETVLTVK